MHKGRLQVLFSLSYNTSGRPKIGQKEEIKKGFCRKGETVNSCQRYQLMLAGRRSPLNGRNAHLSNAYYTSQWERWSGWS
jgi:hypothetical protein